MNNFAYYTTFCILTLAGMYGLKTEIPYAGWVLWVGLIGLFIGSLMKLNSSLMQFVTL